MTGEFFPPHIDYREIEVLQNGEYTVDVKRFRPLRPSSLITVIPKSPQ